MDENGEKIITDPREEVSTLHKINRKGEGVQNTCSISR
jgi:hypothetical protein